MKQYVKPTPAQILAWVKKNFEYKSAQNGEQLRINNPVGKDDGFHLWINTKLGLVHDFRPNHKSVDGTFLWFVKKYKKISFYEAVKEVIGESNDLRFYLYKYDEQDTEKPADQVKIDLPEGFKIFGVEDSFSGATKNYLLNRKITEDQIKIYGIGYAGFDVVFPYKEDDKVVYWQSRSVLNKKFNFPSNSNKTDWLYGYDNIEPCSPIIVTESIFNSLMFDRGVAIGGSSLSQQQKYKIKKKGIKTIILAFDNDDAGRHGMANCYKMLSNEFDLYYSLPDGDDDWNDIAKKQDIEISRKILKKNLKKLDLNNMIKMKL